MINAYLLPKWKHEKAQALSLNRRGVVKLLDEVAYETRKDGDRFLRAPRAPIAANRLLALVRKIFNFGIARDIVAANPCAQLSKPGGKESKRERELTDQEICQLWTALDASDAAGRRDVATIFKLRLLLMQRGQEICRMKWADLDFTGGRE